MKVAIVDDDIVIHPITQRLFSEWADDKQISVEYSFFSNGVEFLEHIEKGERYSIVLMDVYMPGLSGMQTSTRLRAFDPTAILIFLTSGTSHMAELFLCHPFDYILKPIRKNRLFRTLDDALYFLPTAVGDHKLSIQVNRQNIQIAYSHIYYIISDANYCIVATSNTNYRTRVSFRRLEKTLTPDPRFLCVNRGILVNLDFVKSMNDGECIVADQVRLPINSKKKKELYEAFENYRLRS